MSLMKTKVYFGKLSWIMVLIHALENINKLGLRLSKIKLFVYICTFIIKNKWGNIFLEKYFIGNSSVEKMVGIRGVWKLYGTFLSGTIFCWKNISLEIRYPVVYYVSRQIKEYAMGADFKVSLYKSLYPSKLIINYTTNINIIFFFKLIFV